MIGEKDNKEEGEEVVKLEEVVRASDEVVLEEEVGTEATEMENEDSRSLALSVVRDWDLDMRFLTQLRRTKGMRRLRKKGRKIGKGKMRTVIRPSG